MNNKLILVHRNQQITPEFITAETELMQKMLLRIHSLHTFLVSYDLFNVKKRKTVTKVKDITNLYYSVEPPAFQFVISKN
ncbi:hypothetical protein [Deminuibacter soli]|uniref:Uncharacterized protein n=1 Tax=Deminuibacter soli TaxID=2291815 RepID=A0A3E1NLW1_9BACT|nr:hypothetical protein [Deminuibacter soli]RFM28834.1 hypothetical protein DXN05_08660 [Deminuibacter soli]